jgi:CHAT domain-containing protein
VEPAAALTAGKRLIYLAPDDLLYQTPFEVFLTGPLPAAAGAGETGGPLRDAPFWVRSQCLSYLPSASVLRSLRTLGKAAQESQKPLVAFADPIFQLGNGNGSQPATTRQTRLAALRSSDALRGGRLERLPETAEEARRAAQSLGGREEDLYLQLRATEHNLKKLPLAAYRSLLFATHGLLAGEFTAGVQPALALSFVGDPDNDGLLEMGEILGLDLKARLVVLSACNTGRGAAAADRGEGFAGLTRSFMYAGAESLVVTLWSVESQSAAQLMGAFYASLPHQDRAAALAAAKRAMIAEGCVLTLGPGLHLPLSHPFFWAPFVLVGEGR